MMNVIELTRQLGKAIQEDERYKKYEEAAKFNDTDTEIQNSIGRFNQLRSELGAEMRKPDKDADRLTSLDSEIKELYDEAHESGKEDGREEGREEGIDATLMVIGMLDSGETDYKKIAEKANVSQDIIKTIEEKRVKH